ncbi:hypothetical protein QOZ80_1BG0059170 [Eleusine coracana subsp. coracana]|nr:hypothetical protein QOZ80_1BG0059170 [Eleusine coracana subsp. coracana]
MAPPHLKWGQSYYFGESSAHGAIGSAWESSDYSPTTGGALELSLPSGEGKKKRNDVPSVVKHTYTPQYDGHMWRKYGQKNIKDAEYPRLYYRCTYRDDKRCLASKQVQQLNDDEPALYEVLYISEHTCGAPPIPTPVILSEQQTPGARTEGGLVLRFDSAASHRDELVQQQGQYMPAQNSYMMMNFGSSSQMHYQQHVFHYGTGAGASSSSFPAETTLPVPRSTNYSDNGMLSMSELDYSSTCYGFNSHTDFPYNCIN